MIKITDAACEKFALERAEKLENLNDYLTLALLELRDLSIAEEKSPQELLTYGIKKNSNVYRREVAIAEVAARNLTIIRKALGE
ncbi:MAG: hypothetical protein RLZZ292_3937 [Bacteroidota bacterium]|jgi:hypothetical protein